MVSDPKGHLSSLKLNQSIWFGIIASCVAILLFSGSLIHATAILVGQPNEFARLALEDMQLADQVQRLNGPLLWVTAFLWASLEIVGLIMLILVAGLFAGLRRDGVFTARTARRLRRIGWGVFALGPVRVLSEMICAMNILYWQTPGTLHVAFSIEEGDVFAVIVGLVIVSLGHIMLEATHLSDENNAFV